jgi:DNA invertase Pin-like site-specific DNA recombinase
MEYAQREGYRVIDEYVDRAITGKIDDRPQFQKLIRDAKKRQFEYVIVYKLDRFARNRRDSANYRYKLRMDGVRVISAMEQIGDNPESIILEAVLEAQAEYYSVDLSQKVRRGQRETILKGNFLGGFVPYGFKVENKKLAIDEERAAAVRYFFAEYAAGKPKKQIIAELNARGVPSWHGKRITLNSFQHVLKSIKYTGRYEFNGVMHDNYCPRIIDDATFEKAQILMKANKRKAGSQTTPVKYYLSGKAYCGHCGAGMVGVSGTSKTGAKHYYYACAAKYKNKTCDKAAEKKDFIESYVVEQTVLYVLDPARIEFIAERVVAEYDKEFNDDKTKDIEREIAKRERNLDKITTEYIDAAAAVKKRLNERAEMLDAQIDALKIDLAKLRISTERRLTKDEVIAWLKVFTRGDPADEDFQQRIIDIFINSIYLYDDRILIYGFVYADKICRS